MSDPKKPPYESMEQAYEHLLKYENRAPYDYRDDDNWAVVYFDETMVVRLFPTLELPGRWYSWSIYRKNVLVNHEQLSAKFTGTRLVTIYNHLRGSVSRKLDKPVEPALDEEWISKPLIVSQLIWKQFQIIGDRITRNPQTNPMNQIDADKYNVRVDLLKSVDRAGDIKALAKQARIIAEALAENEKTTYTEPELESFARDLAFSGKLKTKQDPSRVVKYYCPQLADMGFMTYPTKRNKVGE